MDRYVVRQVNRRPEIVAAVRTRAPALASGSRLVRTISGRLFRSGTDARFYADPRVLEDADIDLTA
jgi:hypothetical protein